MKKFLLAVLAAFAACNAALQAATYSPVFISPTSDTMFGSLFSGQTTVIEDFTLTTADRGMYLATDLVGLTSSNAYVSAAALVDGSGNIVAETTGAEIEGNMAALKPDFYLDRDAVSQLKLVIVAYDYTGDGTSYINTYAAGYQTSGNTYVQGEYPPSMSYHFTPTASDPASLWVYAASSVIDSPVPATGFASDIKWNKREVLGGWDMETGGDNVGNSLPSFKIEAKVGNPKAIAGLELVDEEGNVLAQHPHVSDDGVLTWSDKAQLILPQGSERIFISGALGGTFAHGGSVTIGMRVDRWKLGSGMVSGTIVLPQSTTRVVTSATKAIWGKKYMPPVPKG